MRKIMTPKTGKKYSRLGGWRSTRSKSSTEKTKPIRFAISLKAEPITVETVLNTARQPRASAIRTSRIGVLMRRKGTKGRRYERYVLSSVSIENLLTRRFSFALQPAICAKCQETCQMMTLERSLNKMGSSLPRSSSAESNGQLQQTK